MPLSQVDWAPAFSNFLQALVTYAHRVTKFGTVNMYGERCVSRVSGTTPISTDLVPAHQKFFWGPSYVCSVCSHRMMN